MSNSLDSFLTRIGDVTIERVTPRGGKPGETSVMTSETVTSANMNAEPQAANDESSDESSGETTDGEHEKKLDALQSEEIEEIRSEGSGDDMDLDETIDSQIGVRVESERQQHNPSQEEDDEEPVNILDTLPLEGAPIEGQEVSEADLLGKPISKDSDDESMDNENEKADGQSGDEEGSDSKKRHIDSEHSESSKKKAKKEDGAAESSNSECELKSEKKLANMRRNIREVMDETQLDEATLSAQRQEMERLRRVQEQQRIIREVQRQIAINRQNKSQTRVISLLQGKQNQAGATTISQSTSSLPSSSTTSSTQVRLPNTVLLKVNSGLGAGAGTQTVQTSSGMQAGGYQGVQTSISRVPNRSGAPNLLQQRIRMMTPSVSISPVVPKKEPMDRADYYSDSEISDMETEEMIRSEKQLHATRKTLGVTKYQKSAKGKDVVTISSTSESSDDDCIVLSDPSGEEETDTEDDPSNSGMHTNDRYNVPDENGRVLINVGHPETEPDVYLAPQVARIIKPHQIGGIRFLFDNIIETIERYKTSSGFGCILAHSMGLGKTLQVASFCDIFFRCTTAKTVLCIMPINTLQNWLAEFNMWLPVDTSIGMEVRPRHFHLHILNDSHKTMTARAKVIQEWQTNGGVLLIGYELYRQLSLKKPNKAKRKRGQPFKDTVDVEEEDKNKGLLDDMHTALVNPGPDLVICDEGHRIKNSHASISMALKQMRTKRRIVLTGYPLQNNLLEYWCMVDFVRPNYLGTKSEFCNMFERPIQNGQCIDSTPQDIRLMRYRAHVLHALLEGFVQRRSHSVLQMSLPRKEEYILLVRMTSHQRKLYDTFMNQVVKTRAVPNPLKAFAVCCKIWNHPDILYHFLRKRQANEEDDLDLEETIGEKTTSDQNQGNNYERPGMFPRQNYPYQDQQRNYPPNLNQGPSNYQPQASNQPSFQTQIPNQSANMPMQDYSSYSANQNQNYATAPAQANPMYPRNDAQPIQNSTMGYSTSQGQQSQPPAPQAQTAGYMPPQHGQNTSPGQNRGFSPNQQNQNLSLQNQSHSYTTQQPQAVPLQGQTHSFQTQMNPTPPQTPHTFNQQSTPMPQTPSHGYMQPNQPAQGSIPQNPMRGYTPAPQNQMNVAQNQLNYPTNQPAQNVNAQSQTHRYPPEQQSPAPNSQNAVHGYSHHIVPQPAASNQAAPYPQQNQQNPAVSPSNQPHSGYPSNHSGPSAMPQTSAHRYGASQQMQMAQNQPMTYPPNQQQPNPSLGPNDQVYPRPDASAVSQQTQAYAPTTSEFSNDRSGNNTAGNPGSNYTANQPQTQNPVMPNYPSDSSHQSPTAVGQIKSADDPYWQRNYPQTFRPDQQCNDSYFRDQMPGVNRYQNNYFPPQNYPNQSYNYSTGHGSDMNARPDESKPSQQPGAHPPSAPLCDKSKDMTSSIGVQSQPMHQSNLTGAPNYAASESNRQSTATPAPRPGQGINSAHSPRLNQSELSKEDEREKEDSLEKEKEDKSDDEILTKDEEKDCKSSPSAKEDPGIPYDWAVELMKNYVPGLIDASAKMTIFLCILEEAITLGDRVLTFSQSLYGQRKPCFVYRLVTDNCLERKIYDRQISKQGMADRVVDQCNPDAHLSLKEATTLSWDWEEDSQVQDFSQTKDSYTDEVMHCLLERHSSLLTKQPFHHESLLVDRKDKKLSQAEKRLARRGYELEKMAANCSRPSYNYVPGNTATRAGGLQIRAIRGSDGSTTPKPVASVRPMQQRGAEGLSPRGVTGSRWIPAEVWQRQGMSAQEMTLPLDVVIPTNSPDKGSIVLKAGQRVMVLKSPKGIYMQLESGKIIAIRTALKLNQQKREEEPKKGISSIIQRSSKPEVSFPLRNNSAISIIPKSSSSNQTSNRPLNKPSPSPGYKPFGDKEVSKRPKPVATATAKPYLSQVNLTNQVSLSRLPKVKQEPMDHSTLGDNSNSSDGQVRTEQRVEEVRLEDVVAEVSSNTEYSPSHTRTTNSDTDTSLPKSSEEGTQVYTSDTLAQGVQTQHDQTESELPSTADKQCSPAEKEPPKSDALMNYNRSFHSQTEKREGSSDDIIIEESSQVTSQMTQQVTPQIPPQAATQTYTTTPEPISSLLTSQPVPSTMSVPSAMSSMPSGIPVSSSIPSNMPSSIPSNMPSSISLNMPSSIPSSMPVPSSMPIPSSISVPSSMPVPSSVPVPSSMPVSSSMPIPSTPVRGPETPKSIADSQAVSSTASVCTSTNITSLKSTEPTTASIRDNMVQGDPTPSVPQGYPYAQYPRYYDYSDPRSRSLSNPYGTYFPGVPPHTANPSSRLPVDTTKPQPDLGKPIDERNVMNVPTAYSSQVPSITAKTLTNNSTATESKGTDTTAVTTTVASSSRDEATHIPTAFSHPTSTRYPGPYPPGPYDPYSQHYPPAPGSSAAYPPGGAPGYSAYGGPSYNTDYARMYSAFHGPPPPTDPYMHRGYAPPSSHPSNYYPPFPHPPPPYPNYPFLSPYPNPNMSSEPQPPAQ
ncbi:Helicase ARIP4 [Ooceraea biroi]|uniref:Helicase ARIP4 n=1 Tax=Ooceraea biroi TaxID=2015173 RepID=A0A026X2J1_OOCBI|nr:Helicase ARIP4 [Ooceraea biroi]